MSKANKYLFRTVRCLVSFFYKKPKITGLDNIPNDEPVIIVGNHTQMNGPIVGELYFENNLIWCAGEMMNFKEVPKYAYTDFWSEKPLLLRPFYKLLSYIIAPLSVSVFTNAKTIPVYHDTRIMTTFRTTIEKLHEGKSIIIFPEYPKEFNNILYDFQDRFIDIASIYYKKYGKEVSFVPMYLAPKLDLVCIGEAVKFSPTADIKEERERIKSYLMNEITDTARALPLHKVIPYKNLPKKLYKTNKETL